MVKSSLIITAECLGGKERKKKNKKKKKKKHKMLVRKIAQTFQCLWLVLTSR